jgi:hypothetical protein
MNEAEWQRCESPFKLLEHLHGKIPDEAFIPFSIACCRRIWRFITDARARALVEATEAAVAGTIPWENVWPVFDVWHAAIQNDEILDLVGGTTNEAIESVCGLGYGHAAQVSMSCFEFAGYEAVRPLREEGASQAEQTKAWEAAKKAERLAQCQQIRTMFEYLPE